MRGPPVADAAVIGLAADRLADRGAVQRLGRIVAVVPRQLLGAGVILENMRRLVRGIDDARRQVAVDAVPRYPVANQRLGLLGHVPEDAGAAGPGVLLDPFLILALPGSRPARHCAPKRPSRPGSPPAAPPAIPPRPDAVLPKARYSRHRQRRHPPPSRPPADRNRRAGSTSPRTSSPHARRPGRSRSANRVSALRPRENHRPRRATRYTLKCSASRGPYKPDRRPPAQSRKSPAFSAGTSATRIAKSATPSPFTSPTTTASPAFTA